MKTNKQYWQDRFIAVEHMRNRQAKDTVDAVTPAFDSAMREIENQINTWYNRYSINNQISLAEAKRQLSARELKELRWDIGEYIAMGEQNALDPKWMKQLENASARYHISRLEALKIRTQQAAEVAFGNELDELDQMLSQAYTESYYHTAYEIQKGLGIAWDIGQLDQARLTKILKKPWTVDGYTFSNRIWKSKQQLIEAVSTEMTQMCILGGKPDQAIKNLAHKMQVSKSQAGRLIMTESAYFGSKAQQDCFKELDVEKYEIVATLDLHTSEICQAMDGKVFKMSDFEPGVTAPPFHPWCRTVTCPFFDDEFTADETRAARDPDTGETYQVPGSMKYPDWYGCFVDHTMDPAKFLKPIKEAPLTISDCTVRTEKDYGFPDGSATGIKKRVEAVIYTTPDGTEFIFPKKYNKQHQKMTPEMAIELWGKMPKNVQKLAQKKVVFVDYYNPQDTYWRKHYKNFTHSYATGGDEITFYRYDYDHDADYVIRTYCHEAGHYIDKSIATALDNYSLESEWQTAMKDDTIKSGKKSITQYGENSALEDFAESVAEISKDEESFTSIMENRSRLLKKILGM